MICYCSQKEPNVARTTVKRLVERVLVDPGSYTWESVSNLQNDLGIDVFTDFLDALSQVEVEGPRFARRPGPPCGSNR